MSTALLSSRTRDRPPLAVIAGPTASGKSELAVRLALAHRPAVIVNADSAQVYRDLRVLSARPSPDETGGVEHRLFGAWDGGDACSAADWAAAAARTIDEIHTAGALPVLVGGTGLYLRTLLEGIAPVPPIDPDVRAAVRTLAQPDARVALEREDPAAAARLGPADRARTARALEVVRSSGRTLADWQNERAGGISDAVSLRPLILLPERAALRARCDARFVAMMASGAVEEVEALLRRKLDPALPVMCAIGVREIAAWLAGTFTREEAIAAAQAATRRYAKRQETWFRHQTPPEWPRLWSDSFNDKAQFATLFQR